MNESSKNSRTPFPVRLGTELFQWLKEQAKAGDRSVNAELVRIVRQTKEEREKTQRAA